MGKIRYFLESEEGRRARYRQRKARELIVISTGVEPQSKRMPDADRDKFQAIVLSHMKHPTRHPFAGPVALEIDLGTTSKNAPQAHTIAKNLLDLLGKRRPTVPGPRAHLFYKDDSQIQALSVACRHGEDQSSMLITGRPFSCLLDDIELAMELLRGDDEMSARLEREYEQDDWIDNYKRLLSDEAVSRRKLGEDLHDGYLKMSRWYAQRAILTRSALDIPTLGCMYGLPRDLPKAFRTIDWGGTMQRSPLRLQFGDLPISPGESEPFKKTLRQRFRTSRIAWTGSSVHSSSQWRSKSWCDLIPLPPRECFMTWTISSATICCLA